MPRIRKKILVYVGLTFITTTLAFQNCSGGFKPLAGIGSNADFRSVGTGTHSLVRNLSVTEINNSLSDILEDTSEPATASLPADPMAPYENDVSEHRVSTPLIEGLEQLAINASARLLANSTKRNRVLGCTGTSATDRVCMTSLVKKLSLRFFRYPQLDDDINNWVDLALAQAGTSNNFYDGVDFILRLFIMNPRFVYRFENQGDDYLNYLRAERLAFMIWGTSPDTDLLTAAANNQLSTVTQVQAKAQAMLTNSKAIRRVQQFHSEWLAYKRLGHTPSVSASLKSEADAMVEKVLFTDQAAWSQIFQTTQTLIDDTVADIYGLPNVGTPTLVTFPANRKGILSTGAYLSAGAKFGDTSPTQRGKFLRERLLCQIIPPPPPTVNADEPPPSTGGSNCKKDRYVMHATQGTSCVGCHSQMDPVGFGLETFDTFGKTRQYEKLASGSDNTACPIEGLGNVSNKPFSGPSALTDIIVADGVLQNCMAQQYFHFAFGRVISRDDSSLISNLSAGIVGGSKFKEVVSNLVGSNQFMNP